MFIKIKNSLLIKATVLSLILMCIIPSFYSNAAGTVFTMSTNSSVKPGEEFKIDLTVSKNEGFAGFDFELHYSNTSLTLVKVEFSEALKNAPNALLENSNSITQMPYKFNFASSENFKANTVLVTFTFKLASNAKLENHEVYVSGEAVNSNKQKLSATFQNGGVVATCSHDTNQALWVKFNHTEATCTTPARTFYRCSECQQQKTEIGTELKPHEFVDHDHKDATCTDNGYDKQICKNCQTVVTIQTYPAIGHEFSDITNIVHPTCVAQGYTVSKCTRCSEEVKSDFIDKIAHDFKESSRLPATCQNVGYIRFTCSVCQHQREDVLDTVEHYYLAAETVEPTHTGKGYTVYRCRYDGCTQSYNSDYTDEIPHTFEYTVVKEPTCTEGGFKTGICTAGCNVTDDVDIPATGHEFGEWYIAVDATPEHDGYKEKACKHCAFKETEIIPKLTQKPSDDQPKNKFELAISYITDCNHPAIIAISLFAVIIAIVCMAYIIIKIRLTR